jgi:argininosuccinate synthase
VSQKELVVLAYSGGLDTSIAIPWIRERYDAGVITLTVDLGQGKSLDGMEERALQAGAVKAFVVDGKEAFVRGFVWPALQAGAVYERQYPLATALGRPLIAQYLVDVAEREGATAVAHGCTGKGNDQVRIDVGVTSLAPRLRIIAPAREWGMTRDEEMDYARERGVPVPTTKASPYSIDENLWGRSIESGVLEDPWREPPDDVFQWTRSAPQTPDAPAYLEIDFERGIPVGVNGETLGSVALIEHLNALAGEHGVGRADHLENRLVGIKSREIYEHPAASVLHDAHRALETLTLGREQQRMKELVAQQYADAVYTGLWFSAHRRDLDAYVRSTQRFVTGAVRVRLHKGACTVVGRRSPHALYAYELATYDKADTFDHQASEGFIKIYGLAARTQESRQPADEANSGDR